MEYTIALAYDLEEGVYNVSVPALPGCYTWGRTESEAIERAREAIVGFLECLELAGDPIPEDPKLRCIKLA